MCCCSVAEAREDSALCLAAGRRFRLAWRAKRLNAAGGFELFPQRLRVLGAWAGSRNPSSRQSSGDSVLEPTTVPDCSATSIFVTLMSSVL